MFPQNRRVCSSERFGRSLVWILAMVASLSGHLGQSRVGVSAPPGSFHSKAKTLQKPAARRPSSEGTAALARPAISPGSLNRGVFRASRVLENLQPGRVDPVLHLHPKRRRPGRDFSIQHMQQQRRVGHRSDVGRQALDSPHSIRRGVNEASGLEGR